MNSNKILCKSHSGLCWFRNYVGGLVSSLNNFKLCYIKNTINLGFLSSCVSQIYSMGSKNQLKNW